MTRTCILIGIVLILSTWKGNSWMKCKRHDGVNWLIVSIHSDSDMFNLPLDLLEHYWLMNTRRLPYEPIQFHWKVNIHWTCCFEYFQPLLQWLHCWVQDYRKRLDHLIWRNLIFKRKLNLNFLLTVNLLTDWKRNQFFIWIWWSIQVLQDLANWVDSVLGIMWHLNIPLSFTFHCHISC